MSTAGKRSYRDPCGIARALDLVGDRWALLVVRELVLGPKRFSDLRSGLPHVSPDILAARLRELEDAGVVSRRVLPRPAASAVYELTEWGTELRPVLFALGRWGSRAAIPEDNVGLGVDAFLLALQTMFVPAQAKGLPANYELRFGGESFLLRVDDGGLAVTRADSHAALGAGLHAESRPVSHRPDLIIESDAVTMGAVLWHDLGLSDAQATGRLDIVGSKAARKRFFRLFPPPVPARSQRQYP